MAIYLAGAHLDEAVFIQEIRARDAEATRLLVAQLREDAQAENGRSPGLVALSLAIRPCITAYVQRTFFAGDPESANEAWNDTLLRVYTRIDAFDPSRASFLTWVFAQASYAAADIRRKRLKAPADMNPISHASDDAPNPLSQVELRALEAAFSRLTDSEQTLLRLRYVLELGNVEIARTYLADKVPEEHVRVYVSRALARLRKNFDEAMDEEMKR